MILNLETKIQNAAEIGITPNIARVCLDYLIVKERASSGFKSAEYCGHGVYSNDIFVFGQNTIEITFRSGIDINDEGFDMTIMCYNSITVNQENCLKVANEDMNVGRYMYYDDADKYEYFDAIKKEVGILHTACYILYNMITLA